MAKKLYKSSITKRLFFNILAIVLIFSLLVLISNSLILKPISTFITKQSLDSAVDEIKQIDFSNDKEIWLDELFNVESNKTFEIMIFKNSEVFYSSSFQPRLKSGPNFKGKQLNPLIKGILAKSVDNSNDLSRELKRELNKANLIVKAGESGDYKFIVLQVVEPINKTIALANRLLIGLTLWFLIIVLVFAFKLSKGFTKPIKKIQSSVAKITDLDFSEKSNVKTNDELEHLSNDINKLSDKLESTLDQLRIKNKELEKDIISQRKFISNASHELRTPLSLIKGYADEIDSGFVKDENQKKAYTKIISSEASKMSRLLKEMLDLSRIQSGRMVFVPEKLSVKEQVCDFVEKYDGYIMDNNLNIELDFSDDNDLGVFDIMRFEQILANYLSNASKYCDAKRIVKLSSETIADKIRIKVINSGKHIDNKIIDRIWDRFYKQENTGGKSESSYGLGLSIVAAIQSLSNQRFGVNNVNGGVEFWFEVEKT